MNRLILSGVATVEIYAQDNMLRNLAFKHDGLSQRVPEIARDENFAEYAGPVGYSWPSDPFIGGSYSYIAPGQEKLMTALHEENSYMVKSLFAPIDHTLYFAGEHASTLLEIPGTMEAACQSGELVASMIENGIVKKDWVYPK